jgi:hypothetical protein
MMLDRPNADTFRSDLHSLRSRSSAHVCNDFAGSLAPLSAVRPLNLMTGSYTLALASWLLLLLAFKISWSRHTVMKLQEDLGW